MRGEITLDGAGGPLYETLQFIGELLEMRRCRLYCRTFHFPLGDGYSIAVRAESAGRLRVEGCRWSRPLVTLWTRADDRTRLAGVVGEVRGMLTVMMGEARV